MKKTAIVTMMLMAACAAEPRTSETEQAELCNAPLYTQCHPYYWGGDQDTCLRTCRNGDGVYGVCPEYTPAEIAYCARWRNVINAYGDVICFEGENRAYHYCEMGLIS